MKNNLRHRVYPGGSRPLHYPLPAEYLVYGINNILPRAGIVFRVNGTSP
jgi:hypothetical protein